jgi:hypothetical protein
MKSAERLGENIISLRALRDLPPSTDYDPCALETVEAWLAHWR